MSSMGKHKILIMTCLFLSVVIIREAFAVDSRTSIRSIIVRAHHPEARTMELLKKYKDAGINYITVYSGAFWMWVEKEPGKYDFSILDEMLNNMRAVGLKAIVRTGAEFPPIWVFTYGKEHKLTEEECNICYQGGKKIDLEKLSVYPIIDAGGNVAYCSGVDPWDATGNYLKLRYIANLVKHMQEKYSDVVDYVDAGVLCEGTWRIVGNALTQATIPTPTWSPVALDSYRRYLQEMYMDVSDANKIYKTNWKNFWEATPPRIYEDTKYFWDWYKWYERGLVTLFMREAAIIRRAGFKVSVMSHFYGAGSDTNSPRPNPAFIWITFSDPYRLRLIDADLYIIFGGYCNITWHDEIPYDPYGKNPLILIHGPGIEVMKNIKKERPNTLFIIEDWVPNPALAEFIGIDASLVDGFQIVQGTIDQFSYHPKGRTIEGKTPEEMFEKLKEAINTFFIFGKKKNK